LKKYIFFRPNHSATSSGEKERRICCIYKLHSIDFLKEPLLFWSCKQATYKQLASGFRPFSAYMLFRDATANCIMLIPIRKLRHWNKFINKYHLS